LNSNLVYVHPRVKLNLLHPVWSSVFCIFG